MEAAGWVLVGIGSLLFVYMNPRVEFLEGLLLGGVPILLGGTLIVTSIVRSRHDPPSERGHGVTERTDGEPPTGLDVPGTTVILIGVAAILLLGPLVATLDTGGVVAGFVAIVLGLLLIVRGVITVRKHRRGNRPA
jgi:hypothetical protein